MIGPVAAQRADGPNANGELRFDYPEVGGVNLGDGWDTGRESPTKNSCLQFTQSANTKPYQTVSYDVRSFEDRSSLMNALDVSASAQLSSVMFKAGIKASYASQTESTFDRIYFVARALVINRSEFVEPDDSGRLMLKPWALDLARNDMANFLRTCGDGYVSSIVSGAELYSVVEITENSQRAREQLKIELTGSGAGMDFTAAFQKASDRYSSQKAFHLTYQKTGGSGDPIPSDLDGVRQAIAQLTRSAVEAPAPFKIAVSRYDTAFNWPTGKTMNWLNHDYSDIVRQYGRMYSLWKLVSSMLNRKSELILDSGVTEQDLKDVSDALQGHVISLAKAAENCLDSNGKQCQIDPKDSISDYEYRVRLPVARGSFAEDLDLVTYTAAVNSLPAELQHAKDLVFNYFRARGFREVPPAWVEDDPNVVAKRDQLNAAEKEFQHLTTNRLSDIKAARLRQWIQTVSDQRCSISAGDPGCLTQSAIDELAKRIIVT